MKAKKSYGQHFLQQPEIARKIASGFQNPDAFRHVCEVGPGTGKLTQFLLAQPFELRVIEADSDMVDYLRVHFPQLNGQILEADFLKSDLAALFNGEQFGLIGNFPYNISSQIIFKMLKYRDLIPEMVGMFQKEVAERIIAPAGSKVYGVISVLTQAYYDGKYLFGVDRMCFKPPPKVQSAVIRLVRKEDQELGCNPRLFKQIVKLSFNQRRKMLRNSMKSFFSDNSLTTDPVFTQRPEQLTVADFVELTNYVEMHSDRLRQ